MQTAGFVGDEKNVGAAMTEPSPNAQIELYGATWASRFAALRAAYRLSQGALALTVGLSATMAAYLAANPDAGDAAATLPIHARTDQPAERPAAA